MVRATIVVPLFNKAQFVERTLRSISAQAFSDFEVIVVDDGSTDGSFERAQAHRDSRFRVLRQANAGPGAARNRGLGGARGEYVAFLDADDEWRADFLSAAIARLDGAPSQVAGVTTAYLDMPARRSTTPLWRARGLEDGLTRVGPATPTALFVALLAYLSPCTSVLRTAVIRRFGGFYARDRCLYGEDAFLFLKVLLNHPILVDLEPRALIHRDASGLSANLAGPRPIEPFLHDPREIEAACPDELRPLLDRVLAARAFKTACVLGYWGDWRRASEIRGRFAPRATADVPYRFASRLCATPLAPPLGAAWRRLRMAQR